MKQDPFERLIRPHMPALFRAAYRLTGNQADSEDLVQDTCITGNAHLDELAACEQPRRWLLRVLYNRFVDGARQRQRSPVVTLENGADISGLASEASNPEQLANQEDRERAFNSAWLELEETQRALLSLRAEGYGLAEIAQITGLAQDVLGPRLHRARRSLQRHLEKYRDDEGVAVRLGSGR
jgi:RNA polymerase sigma-70 factor (ECF subfamily)